MSSVLYDSLVEKWRGFLNQHFSVWSSLISDEETEDKYDELVDKFCDEYEYSKITI